MSPVIRRLLMCIAGAAFIVLNQHVRDFGGALYYVMAALSYALLYAFLRLVVDDARAHRNPKRASGERWPLRRGRVALQTFAADIRDQGRR